MNPLLFAILPEILNAVPDRITLEDNSTAGAAASAAMSEARNVRTEVESLRFDLERVLMITEALWEMLKHEHGYADDILVNLVQQIDLKDGRADGKVATAPKKCPKCHRTLIRYQTKCLYCGQLLQISPFDR